MNFMNEEINPQQPPNNENNFGSKILWLFCAFAPSVVAIACFKTNNAGLFPILIILNLFCSIISGVALIGGIKNKFAAFFIGVFLVLFFLVANAFIAIFIGCSRTGG